MNDSARFSHVGLSAAESARLDTCMIEIASAARGEIRGGPEEWRFGANQALVLHAGGWFYDFAAGKGGHGAVALLAHLYGGDGQAEALAWLANHPGDGQLGRSSGDEGDKDPAADDAERIAYVQGLMGYSQPLGPEALKYLTGRGLDPAMAPQLRWLPGYRGEEGAMLAPAVDEVGVLVAVQLTHITSDGEKSVIEPVRVTLRGPPDWRTRGAFRIGEEEAVELTLTEGVEDAISARMAGAERVWACLGISGLGRAQLPSNVTRTVVCRDDDVPGSEACKALGRGVGRLLLQARQVGVTPRAGALAEGCKDINDLLQKDIELARLQLEQAALPQAMLGPAEKNSLLDEISRAETDAYENGRVAAAAALNWRTTVLDEDRKKRRQDRAKQGEDPVTGNIDVKPWPDPITDLSAVLDEAVKEVARFLIVPTPAYLYAVALWCAHTHLVHRKELGVEYTPRLGFQSPVHECGKSTGLKCAHLMSHNSRPAASISASAMFRAVDAFRVSLMVEEGDQVFKGANPDLLAIMNAGADRMLAKVMRSEKTDDGKFLPREFSCFAPVAFTSIKQVPKTLQSRAIVLRMQRAAKDEQLEQLTVRTRAGLIDVGRKLMRWAADLGELPDPDLPQDLFNRIEDRWFTLFQIAHLAKGEWPERCRRAALGDLAQGKAEVADGGVDGDLLRDIWEVFHASKKPRMFTKEICSKLLALDESPWMTANGGKPVDDWYLRTHLRDFLPVNIEKIALRKWREGKVEQRGFDQLHLADAFKRYLGRDLPCSPDEPNKPPGGEDTSQKGPSQDPSHPSHPSQGKDTSTISDGCNETDVCDGSVSAPSSSVAEAGLASATGGATDPKQSSVAPSVAENIKDNQHTNRKATDATDATDPVKGSRKGIAPPADHPAEKPNNGVFPDSGFMPRGAQPRRRRRL
jgi:putative DNA primase/helicase